MLKTAISKQQFADLYILDILGDDLPNEIKKYKRDLLISASKEYVKDIGEAIRHELSKYISLVYYPQGDNKKMNELKMIGINNSSDLSRVDVKQLTLKECEVIFKNGIWKMNYGGDAWANITNLIRTLDSEISSNASAGKIMHTLDLIHQLEHNTASIFRSLSTDQHTWIHDLLTEKALTSSVAALYKYLSEDVRKVLENSFAADLINLQDDDSDEFIETELRRAKAKKENMLRSLAAQQEKYDLLLNNDIITQQMYDDMVLDISYTGDKVSKMPLPDIIINSRYAKLSEGFVRKYISYFYKINDYNSIIKLLSRDPLVINYINDNFLDKLLEIDTDNKIVTALVKQLSYGAMMANKENANIYIAKYKSVIKSIYKSNKKNIFLNEIYESYPSIFNVVDDIGKND